LERIGVYALIAAAIIFGFVVEMRSAYMQRRMTDVGVYLRAGWAVRAGENIYEITDANCWHYNYPPLFAILMVPLADPPDGIERAGALPYEVSVAVWYALNLLFLIVALHWLARALEARSADPQVRNMSPGCRRWWALRLIPLLACVIPIAHSLMRGQVNLLVLALLCGAAASMVHGQGGRAGALLAGAICLKVIPAFLILVPLWRRDWRCLGGCAAGLIIGLFLIPASVFGVPKTLAYYKEYDEKVLRPGLGAGGHSSRATELIELTSNDSQSIMAAIHNTLHPDRLGRPPQPSAEIRWAHRLIGGLLTLVTLLASGWRPARDATSIVLFFGAVSMVMLLLSPVCHMHYFCLAVPLVMALVSRALDRTRPSPRLIGVGLTAFLCANVAANALPHLPGLMPLRDMGLAMYAGLILWGLGCLALWRQRQAGARIVPPALSKAAA
jgi:hypothetical protein